MADWLPHLALFGTGLVAGVLNVLAGGGSFLTLPVLIFLGLPATLANGTNRVGILLQNVGAVWGFHRHRVLPWRWALAAAVPATVGAALGTGLALWVSDEAFRKVLAALMVAVTLWTLLDPTGRSRRGAEPGNGATGASGGDEGERIEGEPIDAAPGPLAGGRLLGVGAGFFVVGIYGGFVQAGVGFLILAVTTAAGLDLVRGNALKVLSILVFTVLSLTLFASQGQVAWGLGAVLGAGNFLGGQLGVRLTVLKGHRWVKGFVTVMVIVFALELWLRS
jgi:uncharacterized membrane protein YfcA